MPDGSVVFSESIKDYKLEILEDNEILNVLTQNNQYLTMLVRDRIDREKMEYQENEEYED